MDQAGSGSATLAKSTVSFSAPLSPPPWPEAATGKYEVFQLEFYRNRE
jgi:hypothetical protein